MSAAYNEAVKQILADVNKFLTNNLKSESLSKSAQKERGRLQDQLLDLFTKYDSLAPSFSEDGSASSFKDASLDESRNTTGSEEDAYSDSVADTTVKALTAEADKIGYLDKKHKDLFVSSWKKMYCVLHKGVFYYFKKPGDKKQQGAFYVTGYTAQEAPQNVKDSNKKDASFELVCPGKRTYQFCADNNEDFLAWKKVISCAELANLTQDDDDDGEELYEPLDPSDAEPHKLPSMPAQLVPPVVDDENDDLIYEAVDTRPAPPPLSPAQRPLPAMPPLPPLPRNDLPPPPRNDLPPPPRPLLKIPLPPLPKDDDDDSEPPPPPLPERGHGTSAAPALPKRNSPQVPVPSIPPKKKRVPSLGKLPHPAEDFENMFYGIYKCKGSTENELNFERGDVIHIINRELDAESWWIGELAGKIGLVPKSYLHPAYDEL